MEQPSRDIRELRKNQTSTDITLDNHTALLQEICQTLDSHTQRLDRIEQTLSTHTDLLTTLTTLAVSHTELLKQILEKKG